MEKGIDEILPIPLLKPLFCQIPLLLNGTHCSQSHLSLLRPSVHVLGMAETQALQAHISQLEGLNRLDFKFHLSIISCWGARFSERVGSLRAVWKGYVHLKQQNLKAGGHLNTDFQIQFHHNHCLSYSVIKTKSGMMN